MLSTSEKQYLIDSMEDLLYEYDYEYNSSAVEQIIDEWSRQKAGFIEAFKKHPNYLEGKFMIAFDADYERKIEKRASTVFGNWILDVAAPKCQRILLSSFPFTSFQVYSYLSYLCRK